MDKSSTKFANKFNRSHENLRKFLKLVAHGCYSRNLFAQYSITPRTYDDFLRQLRFFIPEENLQVTLHARNAYFTFTDNLERGSNNYLHASFLLKSLLPEHCLYFILILQWLNREKKPMQFQEILMALDGIEYASDILKSESYFRNRLEELIDAGLVRRTAQGQKFFFELLQNPLGSLSAEESAALINAVKFYRNCALLEVPGYFLRESLKEIYRADAAEEIFRLKNNNLARILDDEILFQAIQAINDGKKICVEREGSSPVRFSPAAVETDYIYNRQYLAGTTGGEPLKLRVDKILKLKVLNEPAEPFVSGRKKLREIRLRVTFSNSQERALREKILREHLNYEIAEEGVGFFVCKIFVVDPLQYYPELWKFQPWAEILHSKLRERINNDVEEALKNYDEPV